MSPASPIKRKPVNAMTQPPLPAIPKEYAPVDAAALALLEKPNIDRKGKGKAKELSPFDLLPREIIQESVVRAAWCWCLSCY